MNTCLMKSQLLHSLQTQTRITPKFSYLTPTTTRIPAPIYARFPRNSLPPFSKIKQIYNSKYQEIISTTTTNSTSPTTSSSPSSKEDNNHIRRITLFAAGVAAGFGLLLMGLGHDDKAWALGPEGPLVEEFWENVRRYALYALTVSTGVVYTVVQPIYELLKNPISAVLVLVIIGGTFFIVSQILSAMVGVSDFSYQYAY